ncbi:hypothetical protein HanPSC8_Chr10g0409601 [Helianthus annuus]|nr:hypothetical protein HanPSC8_Chr10g0409601 [Helianthus annuus]
MGQKTISFEVCQDGLNGWAEPQAYYYYYQFLKFYYNIGPNMITKNQNVLVRQFRRFIPPLKPASYRYNMTQIDLVITYK